VNCGDDCAGENREKRFSGRNKKAGRYGWRHDPTSSLKTNETQFVTLIYMSTTISDISIAIAGCGVTIEPGANGA
jgi:hypothetical protein